MTPETRAAARAAMTGGAVTPEAAEELLGRIDAEEAEAGFQLDASQARVRELERDLHLDLRRAWNEGAAAAAKAIIVWGHQRPRNPYDDTDDG